MDIKEIIVMIIIPAIAAGILVPIVIRGVLKWQREKRLKLLKDNGKTDLIDEISTRVKKDK